MFRNITFVILSLVLLPHIGYCENLVTDNKQIVIQGSIQIQPVKLIPGDTTGKIQPGTPVKLKLAVENQGEKVSPAGVVFIRFAYAHPLENENNSVIFETEKKPLPVIKPGEKLEVEFESTHQIPSLLDFVRYDWPIREYQAIAVINKQENPIGTHAITFSAYYYPGIKQDIASTYQLD